MASASDVFQRFNLPAGPANFTDSIFVAAAKPEVEVKAKVVLREGIARPARLSLSVYAGGGNRYPGADGGAIALCAAELEEDAM